MCKNEHNVGYNTKMGGYTNSSSDIQMGDYPMGVVQKYAPSRYNHFFRVDDKYLAINLLTNAVLSLDDNEYKLVRNLLERAEMPRDPDERALYELLAESKFIIPREFNEMAYLERLFKISKGCKKGFSLGPVITLRCNFRCPYCYQDHVDVRMGREVQLAILAFLEKNLPSKEAFHVDWWGGEPLLEPQIIDKFGNEMIQLCNSLHVKYTSSVTTNGYLLNEDNIRILADGYLSHVQVTLDGPKEFHDRRRFLANGKGTYDVILENLYELASTLPDVEITIRANISRGITKVESWEQLLTDLAPIKRSIAIFLAPVAPARNFNKLCISNQEFYAFYDRVIKMIQRRGFRITLGRATPGTVYCGAIPVDNWFVHPRGYISKCTAQVDRAGGNLGKLLPDGSIKLNSDAAMWLSFSPFNLEKCRECNVLPLCMGGCLKEPFDDPFLDRCHFKKVLLSFIKDGIIKQKGGE
jgi:uncharacterized protein